MSLVKSLTPNKKIIFDGIEIIAKDAKPLLVNPSTGKVAFFLEVPEENATWDQLYKLKDNTAPIEYYEQDVYIDEETREIVQLGEWTLKNVYYDYDSGDYTSKYENGVYECKIARLTEEERRARKMQADLAYMACLFGVELSV